jgi:carbonic anhydrase
MHVHAPSEHTVRGVHYDAEAHFVHMSKDNKAIVIAVFLQRGEEEEDDDSNESESATEPFFAKLFDALDDVEEDVPVSAALYAPAWLLYWDGF